MPLYRINGRTVLFLHVPKAGGTSVHRFLSAHGAVVSEVKARDHTWAPCPPQHFHAAILRQIIPQALPDLVLSVVRHPARRLESEFFYRHLHRGRTRSIGFDFRIRPFAAMDGAARSHYFARWARDALRKHARDPFHLSNHLRPQVEFADWPGIVTYRLEDGLAAALADLAVRLDLPPPADAPRENMGGSRLAAADRQLDWPDALRQRVREIYAADLARWYPGEERG